MGRHLGQGRRESIAHLEDSLVDLLLLFQPLEILVLLLAARSRGPFWGGSGFGVWSSGFRVQGLGLRFEGLGSNVEG